MKITAGVFLIVVFWSCRETPHTTILKVFQPEYKAENNVSTKVYIGRNYLESGPSILFPTDTTVKSYTTTLFLNSDSTFTYCDYIHGSHFGKWRGSRDTAILIPYSKRSNNIAFKVFFSKTESLSKTVFIVTDKTNNPIENFTVQPFNSKPRYVYDLQGELHTAEDAIAKADSFWNLGTDRTGRKTIDKRKSDSLDFTKLYPLTHRRYSISTKNLPDTVRLTINLNGLVFFQNEIHIVDMSRLPRSKVILHKGKFVFPFD